MRLVQASPLFALPGSAIVTIILAGIAGTVFEGDSGAYFIQDGPMEWLTAGVMNFGNLLGGRT